MIQQLLASCQGIIQNGSAVSSISLRTGVSNTDSTVGIAEEVTEGDSTESSAKEGREPTPKSTTATAARVINGTPTATPTKSSG